MSWNIIYHSKVDASCSSSAATLEHALIHPNMHAPTHRIGRILFFYLINYPDFGDFTVVLSHKLQYTSNL